MPAPSPVFGISAFPLRVLRFYDTSNPLIYLTGFSYLYAATIPFRMHQVQMMVYNSLVLTIGILSI
jgi:hypothetical protein